MIRFSNPGFSETILALVAMLGVSAGVQAQTLDGVEADITAHWDKMKSASYDMDINYSVKGQGYAMKMVSKGTTELMHEGDLVKMRSETTATNDMTMGTNVTKTDTKSLMVVDGTFAWSLTDTGGKKTVMKMKAQGYSQSAGGKSMFKILHETYDLALLADETVDGQAAYVIEAKSKAKDPSTSSTKYYFSKSNGLVIQSVTAASDGKTMTTLKVSNLKIDPALPADRFTFTPPAGVQVTDMSNP